MRTIIYYFSGTGNSLKIAKDVSKGIAHSELQHIAVAMEQHAGGAVDYEKVGIVFPVYVEGLHVIVERFVRNQERNPVQ